MSSHTDPQPRIIPYQLAADGAFPNNPSLPLLLYKGAKSVAGEELTDVFEQLLESNEWGGCWVDGVFAFQHFHSNAHEALGVCGGAAEVQFGGPNGPTISLEIGDLAILPAGTAHKKISAKRGFRVIGAYPAGQEDYDMMRGESHELREAMANIARVPLPAADPVFGANGPLFDYWR